ncbi:FUSC family protein [Streptomyces sp. NPDC026672]|uniref:FUSC family protein n=1 Tax=unclassified Streptomyces TaxID=2593676 RepID=UPI0033F35CA3
MNWLREHDPQFAATRRAARTALVMPSLFALCVEVIGSPTMATFAAFGSFSMLLLTDFSGPLTQRLRAQLGLTVAWLVLICLGTLAAQRAWLAITGMVVVGFLVLFAGVVSSVLAGVSTPLLLAFVLPLTVPVPLSELPARLAGAGLAAAVALPAVTLLWPRPPDDALAAPAARACRALAAQLRDDVAGADPGRRKASEAAADEALAALRGTFDATPYRPAGLSISSRALVRLIDELTWLHGIVRDDGARTIATADDSPETGARRCTAALLERAAGLLDAPRGSPEAFREAVADLRKAMEALDGWATDGLPALPEPSGNGSAPTFIERWESTFRAHELCFATLQIAHNVGLMAAAERRSWPERLLGHDPAVFQAPLRAALERAASHVRPQSVWLHNSVRGALGLGLAVAVIRVVDVQHSFWVLLGILSVLSSSAVATGQRALRALGGTAAGALVGAGLLELVGGHGGVLWVLLPLAVLAAGIATPISFAVGQAAFAVTLVVLFNVGRDPSWQVALLRVEDIAIGCGVSLLAGLIFWPRGAAAAVDRALAEAYADAARYLDQTLSYALHRCGLDKEPPPIQDSREAAAAARRLDDAFRSYLSERGTKTVPLADMTTLVTGVAAVRLAADSVVGLWRHAGPRPPGAAETEALLGVRSAARRISGWYESLAGSLRDDGSPPTPQGPHAEVEALLVRLLRHGPKDRHGQAVTTAVRIVWTADYLKATRRLQPGLAGALESRGG